MSRTYADVTDLYGKTMESVRQVGNDEIVFKATDGSSYRMYHSQNCCESVTIDDVCGDLNDLVGSPLLRVEENSSEDATPDGVEPPEYGDSYTWTFYRLATARGDVTIRWFGGSNGYYSERVDFEQTANAATRSEGEG